MKKLAAFSIVLIAALSMSGCGFSKETCVQGPLGNGGCVSGGIGVSGNHE